MAAPWTNAPSERAAPAPAAHGALAVELGVDEVKAWFEGWRRANPGHPGPLMGWFLNRIKQERKLPKSTNKDQLRTGAEQWLATQGQTLFHRRGEMLVPLWPEAAPSDQFFCTTCNVQCNSAVMYFTHMGGAAHWKRLAAAEDAAAGGTRAGFVFCEPCSVPVPKGSMPDHVRGQGHLKKAGMQLVHSIKASGGLQANAEGVVVTEFGSGEGEVRRLTPGTPATASITITSAWPEVAELQVSQLDPVPQVALVSPTGPVLLAPGQGLTVSVRLASDFLGIFRTVVLLRLKGGEVVLARRLAAYFEMVSGEGGAPTSVMESMGPITPYTFNKARLRVKVGFENHNAVPGEPPPRITTNFERKPGQHKPPADLARQFNTRDMSKATEQLQQPVTDLRSMAAKTRTLLHLEELQHQYDVRQYDLSGVELRPSASRGVPPFLILQVPGLAENRPSVLKGDRIYVRPLGAARESPEYEGHVHHVGMEEVSLKFASSFHKAFIAGAKYDVRFTVSRSTFCFMQEALDLAMRSDASAYVDPGALMPHLINVQLAGQALEPRPIAELHSPGVRLNPEQVLAVEWVVSGSHWPAPYLIYGPPGTGKTSTVVEAVVQVLKQQPRARVLVCAPSNSATDLVVERVLDKRGARSEMMRINAYQRPREDVPDKMMDVSNWDDGVGAFVLPTKEKLTSGRVRIVAATCLMAAKLWASGLPAGHFTHVFVDEAGHAEEPLSMCAIMGLLGPQGRLILAGDPKQLGPVVLSPVAAAHGLATSTMERIIQDKPYVRSCALESAALAGPGGLHSSDYDARFLTKLVRNYRSHPDILAPSNTAFYAGDLQPCADPIITHSMLGRWDRLPNKSFPIIFHAVEGKDEREGSSPSWFNAMEVQQVEQYIKEMKTCRQFSTHITDADIGVVTPYRRQVQKIRRRLQASGHPGVKVGSVEEFQGQERKVILISTVRSSNEFISFDLKHRLGFVASPKRLNVAITRAKACLIIIGNPKVLVEDPLWAGLLKYIQANGGCTGSPMPPISEGPRAGTGAASASGSAQADREPSSGFMLQFERMVEQLAALAFGARSGSQAQALVQPGPSAPEMLGVVQRQQQAAASAAAAAAARVTSLGSASDDDYVDLGALSRWELEGGEMRRLE